MKTLLRLLALGASAMTLFVSSQASAACVIGCTYAKTQYPIVLAHGAIGFESAFGILDYWYGTVEDLRDYGATVFTTSVSPFDSTEKRGEALLAQIQTILATTGAAKVNLIGHAQGGMDIRYVARVKPQLVASVTTINTPHTGSAPFNLLNQLLGPPSSTPSPLLDLTDEILGAAYKFITGGAQQNVDLRASAQSLSYAGAAAFNRANPAGMPSALFPCGNGAASANGIRFYSWNGTSLLTNVLDPTDVLFAPLALLTPGKQTEGFTERCSSHFGTVIRDDYPFNHLDSVNNAFGMRGAFAPDPVGLFRMHANRLKLLGL